MWNVKLGNSKIVPDWIPHSSKPNTYGCGSVVQLSRLKLSVPQNLEQLPILCFNFHFEFNVTKIGSENHVCDDKTL